MCLQTQMIPHWAYKYIVAYFQFIARNFCGQKTNHIFRQSRSAQAATLTKFCDGHRKSSRGNRLLLCKRKLLFDDLQQFHGANLGADAAGNALGSGILGLHDHNLHGAGLHALAAADAELLVDHVNAGLGILGDGAVLTGAHALAALDAGHRLGAGTLGNHLDAGQILMEFLIESSGTGTDTFQTCHALNIFLNSQLLHSKSYPFSLIFYCIIQDKFQNSNG